MNKIYVEEELIRKVADENRSAMLKRRGGEDMPASKKSKNNNGNK